MCDAFGEVVKQVERDQVSSAPAAAVAVAIARRACTPSQMFSGRLVAGVLLLSLLAANASPRSTLEGLLGIRRNEPYSRHRALEAEHVVTGVESDEALEETEMKWTIVWGITALGATLLVGFLLESNHIHWLPEAGVGVLMGALASGLAVLCHDKYLLTNERFDFEFFMTWLPPPIIFEAGYNMNTHAFFANAAPTMLFAFVGTFLSTFVVGGIVYYAGLVCWP